MRSHIRLFKHLHISNGLLLLIVFTFISCDNLSFIRDPLSGPFPFKFQKVREVALNANFVDLDKDGNDECLFIINPIDINVPSYILIQDRYLNAQAQINFNGFIQKPYIFDWSGDGRNELVVPYTINDTLFIRIINQNWDILKDISLFAGKARMDSSGVFPWQGTVKKILYEDLNGDGLPELIVFPSESFARSPRGVYVYHGQTFQLQSMYEIGPFIKNMPSLIDINNDGIMEILLPTSAVNNGNMVNGTDDQHSYLFLIDHRGNLIWQRKYGGKFSSIEARVGDFDGNGTTEIATFFSEWHDMQIRPSIEIIDPVDHHTINSFELPMNYSFWEVIQTDTKIDKEFIIVGQKGKILLLNSKLETINSQTFNTEFSNVFSCEDLNNDGFEEIFVGTSEGTLWLDHNLAIQAKTSLLYGNQVYHRRGDRPLLTMFKDNNGEFVSLEKDRWYLISYYGPYFALFFGVILLIGLIGNEIRLFLKSKFYYNIIEKSAALHKNPVFLIDHQMRIIFTNTSGRELMQIQESQLPVSVSSLLDNNTKYMDFLASLRTSDAVRQEKELKIESDNGRIMRFIAEPISRFGKKHLTWLVMFEDNTAATELDKAKTWAAMSQRIAHEINNPLSSILLTLQRLQMEYRDQNKSKSTVYDRYTDRIIERIESLRRMSRGFMKFLNLEKLNPQPTEINQFLEGLFAYKIIELPRDIQLQKKLASDLPATHLDQEQIQSLFENLFTNAVNAMPDGGIITISTSLALNLQIDSQKMPPRDYLVIEIADTGVGIPADIRDKLFQPFTTRTHSGTGLGLTIVKKIVDDHKGHIEVNSDEGIGTSFLVYLPVA